MDKHSCSNPKTQSWVDEYYIVTRFSIDGDDETDGSAIGAVILWTRIHLARWTLLLNDIELCIFLVLKLLIFRM